LVNKNVLSCLLKDGRTMIRDNLFTVWCALFCAVTRLAGWVAAAAVGLQRACVTQLSPHVLFRGMRSLWSKPGKEDHSSNGENCR